MAAANAQVNKLVALQAEMLLRAAEVRSSRRYRNLAKCQVSRIGSVPMKKHQANEVEVARQTGGDGVAHEVSPARPSGVDWG